MNVKELKEELSKYPDNMDVFLDQRTTNLMYGLVDNVKKQMIIFTTELDSDLIGEGEVVIISEQYYDIAISTA